MRAPLRSMRALVAKVVPWTKTATSAGATAPSPITFSKASKTPASGARGVVRTLAVRRPAGASRTTSVNVPPISAATRTRELTRMPYRSPAADVILPTVAGHAPSPRLRGRRAGAGHDFGPVRSGAAGSREDRRPSSLRGFVEPSLRRGAKQVRSRPPSSFPPPPRAVPGTRSGAASAGRGCYRWGFAPCKEPVGVKLMRPHTPRPRPSPPADEWARRTPAPCTPSRPASPWTAATRLPPSRSGSPAPSPAAFTSTPTPWAPCRWRRRSGSGG